MISKRDRHTASIKLEEAVNCLARIAHKGDVEKEVADARRLVKEADKILKRCSTSTAR